MTAATSRRGYGEPRGGITVSRPLPIALVCSVNRPSPSVRARVVGTPAIVALMLASTIGSPRLSSTTPPTGSPVT